MTTRKKSHAMRFLEHLSGRPLTLGGLLQSIRLSEEMSQAAFAKKLRLSSSHLCDIEKGRKVVSPGTENRPGHPGKELESRNPRVRQRALPRAGDHQKIVRQQPRSSREERGAEGGLSPAAATQESEGLTAADQRGGVERLVPGGEQREGKDLPEQVGSQ